MGTMSEVVTSRPPAFEKKTSATQIPPTDKQKPNTCSDHHNAQNVDESDSCIESQLEPVECFGPYFRLIPCSGQVKELQTIIRDRNTSRSDFKFYADRLIRLVVEEGLNQLPYSDCSITTPTGCQYQGLQFVKGNCGVSIVRSGEAMEQGLRSCCRSIRLGKILVESDLETHEARVVYAKFPEDISQRKVLLMYPIMNAHSHIRSSSSCTKSFWTEVLWHRLMIGVLTQNVYTIKTEQMHLCIYAKWNEISNCRLCTVWISCTD
ncbi:hypothetical protein OTU49_007333 [Cherax quadricarinatus]|uniref:Phosphoribosyltransferase domain-containing protein n=2 Tax=Cherax quadricarinatus TaxID=27406 RepID=A0AAW0WM40_CHEQU